MLLFIMLQSQVYLFRIVEWGIRNLLLLFKGFQIIRLIFLQNSLLHQLRNENKLLNSIEQNYGLHVLEYTVEVVNGMVHKQQSKTLSSVTSAPKTYSQRYPPLPPQLL